MSPSEVLGRHSSRELTEWMAYLQIEPAGEERADLRAGIIASTVANAHRSKKSDKTYTPEDFMPRFDEPSREQTLDEQQAMLDQMVKVFGGERGKLDTGSR